MHASKTTRSVPHSELLIATDSIPADALLLLERGNVLAQTSNAHPGG